VASATVPVVSLTTVSGGINRLRTKGGADKNSLFDLLNGYVTQANTVKVRPGTYRNANIAQYSGAGLTKGLLSYQSQLHIFSSQAVEVPPNYALHVLNYPANSAVSQNLTFTDGTFAATTQIGTGSGYGAVSSSSGFAKQAIINPEPSGDIGSVTPTTFLDVSVEGFFQALGSSTHDPNEVYLVTNPALPTTATIAYQGPSGLVTVSAASALTTNLGLAAGYAAYALGTGTPSYDPSFGLVSLLMHFDTAQFLDSSANNLAVTIVGSPVLDTSGQKVGTGALEIPSSSGSYLTVPAPAGGPLDLGSGDWTIEFYMKLTAAQGTQSWGIMGSDSGWGILMDTSNDLWWVDNGISVSFGPAPAMSTNVWYAVAFQRAGNAASVYINGTRTFIGAATFTGIGAVTAPVNPFTIGYNSAANNKNLELDELRITKGLARYGAGGYSPSTSAFPNALTLTYNNSAPFLIKEIHFAAAYLGGIYVVAEFDVTNSALEAEFGSVFHYWIQSSTGGDNSNEWEASTDYSIGDVVIPTAPNGLTYVASRKNPANPIWTENTIEAIGNIVEPTVANGFKYTVVATLGATPTTGVTEPTWPTADGATVLENSSLENDQTITLATAADATTTPSVPARYVGLYSP
jgi:Concanavalin A-like lectin/glucanases superfamily